MKIVIVTQGNIASGAEIITSELYSTMKKDVIILSGSDPIIDFYTSKNFTVKKIKGLSPIKRSDFKLSKIPEIFKSIYLMRKEIHKINPYYIHVYNIASLLYVTLSVFRLKIPILLHVHDFYTKDKFICFFARLLKNRPKKIIAVSQSVRSDLIKIGFNGLKTYFVHNGIDVKINDTLQRGNGFEKISVGFVASISRWKGLHVLLKAAEILDKKGYSLNYTIVGPFLNEDYKRSIMQIAGNVKRSEITFLGKQNDARNLMRNFDILVHCSIENDPFPTVILEGMFNHCSVIGSDGGGVPEIITDGETGLLHTMGSSSSLARVIEKLVDNKRLREKLALNGYSYARKNLTLKRFQNTFFNVVNENMG